MCFSDFSSCNLIGLASSLAISVGENLEEAFSLADFVEEIAKTQFITHTLNLIK